MRNIRYVFIILMNLAMVLPVLAGPSFTTYQARIVKPDGYPLEDANVNFKFSVLTPAGNCILYSETFSSVNMMSSGGYVTFSLGSGTKEFPTDATNFKDILSNSTPTLNCAAGGLPFYIPQSTDTRKLVMQFNHAGKWQTIPAMNMNAIPYAMYADDANTLNGKTESEFVFKSAIPTCVGDQRLAFNGVAFSCTIANAASGTVSVTSVSQALGYTPVAPASLTTVANTVTGLTTDVTTLASNVSSLTTQLSALDTNVSSLTANSSTLGNNITNVSSTLSFLNSEFQSVSATVTVLNNSVSELFQTTQVVSGATYSKVLVDGRGRVISGSNITALDISTALGFSPVSSTVIDLGTAQVTGTLSVARLPALSGDVNSVSGSSLVFLNPVGSGITSGSAYSKVTVDGKGRVITGSNITALDISTALGFSPVSSTVIDLGTAQVTGTLSVARLPAFGGDVNSVSGSSNLILNSSGVLAGSYNQVTVDSKGRVTSGTNVSITSSQWLTSGTSISYTAGNVGIGTTSPQAKLDLAGTLLLGGPGDVSLGADIKMDQQGLIAAESNLFINVDSDNTGTGDVIFNKSSDSITGAVPLMTIKNSGSVGIGTTNPQTTLDVSGAIRMGSTSSGCSAANEGAQRYNSTSKLMEFCNGTAWTSIGAGGSSAIPEGAVMAFARNTCPTGWIKANGAAISRTTYSALFTAIGTSFGAGDGSTTFNVPDLRGEFVRGWDDARGIDAARTFASAQADAFKSHTHTPNGFFVSGQSGADGDLDGSTAVTGYDKSTMTGTLSSTGGTETRPRNIALLYCIKN